MSQEVPQGTRTIPTEKFLVAFSLAGEQRDLVRPIAEEVERRLGRGTVFYDEWYEYYIAGDDADLKLQEVYGDQSELVVTCISEAYGGKPWTQAEYSAIRALKMRTDDRNKLLPIRVGDGNVPGIEFNTIAPDIRDDSAAETAINLIIPRLCLIRNDLEICKTMPSVPGKKKPTSPEPGPPIKLIIGAVVLLVAAIVGFQMFWPKNGAVEQFDLEANLANPVAMDLGQNGNVKNSQSWTEKVAKFTLVLKNGVEANSDYFRQNYDDIIGSVDVKVDIHGKFPKEMFVGDHVNLEGKIKTIDPVTGTEVKIVIQEARFIDLPRNPGN